MFFGIYGIVNPKEKEEIKLRVLKIKSVSLRKKKIILKVLVFTLAYVCGLSNGICVMK